MNGQKMVVYTGTVPIETQFAVAKDAPKGRSDRHGKAEVSSVQQPDVFPPVNPRCSFCGCDRIAAGMRRLACAVVVCLSGYLFAARDPDSHISSEIAAELEHTKAIDNHAHPVKVVGPR